MRTFLRDILMVALLLAAASPAYGRLGPSDYRLPPVPRGAQRDFIRDFAGIEPIIQRQIFDGDRWLPLRSEDGWQLFIEIQHEEVPDAQE